jgi:peptidyl-prolyl cis-trans isomerase D
MQKNNKYLVPTIWIATIAFIGAGAVGWGSMKFGDKSSSIAKVGDISISKMKYSFTSSNLYSQYAQKLGNKFDKEMAKKLGLDKQVYNSLIRQALLLNLAKEYGIIVTEKEVGEEIIKYNAFKDKSGVFNKSIYDNFLKARGMKAKDFEAIIKDDLTIMKLQKLLDVNPVKFEKEVLASTFKIADRIKYAVINAKDVNVTLNESDIKAYWEKNKLNYLTPTKYKLELVWTKADNIKISDEELKSYFDKNSYEFTDNNGKVKNFDDVKDQVKKAVALSKIKKDAAIARSRFKKGKIKAQESIEIAQNDPKFTKEIWQAIQNSKDGDFIKPKVVKDAYVTIHLVSTIKPQPKSFDEAKSSVEKELKAVKIKEELNKIADSYIKDPSKLTIDSKDFITLSEFKVLPSLTPQDSQTVTRKLFGSTKAVDKIELKDSIVVYKIEEQKLIENNSSVSYLDKEIKTIKSNEFNTNLYDALSKKYKVQQF